MLSITNKSVVISCFSETSEHQGSRGKKKKNPRPGKQDYDAVLTGDTKNQNKITFSKERRQHGELSQSCGHSTLKEMVTTTFPGIT